MTTLKSFYSIPEAAEVLCVSTSTLWRLVKAQKIEIMRVAQRVIITDDAIIKFRKSNSQTWNSSWSNDKSSGNI